MAKIILQVTYEHTGRAEVVGNVDSKGLCYAALESAKDLIRDFHNLAIKPEGFGTGRPFKLETESEDISKVFNLDNLGAVDTGKKGS